MSKRQVLLNCDEKGKIPISVAIYSILKSADPTKRLDVYLIHDTGFEQLGGCEQVKSVVARFPFATVTFANLTETLAAHPELNEARWPPMTWAWTFAAEIFPEVGGNLVFIDWDMYVRKDLAELYDLDLEGRGFVSAAVDESRREHRPLLVAAGWPEEAGYSVNSGLQVINVDVFRRERLREKMFAWYAKNKVAAECVEQDSANVIYGARILRLHLKYNFTVGWFDRMFNHNPFAREWRVYPPRMVFEACADPAILHFIGHRKPWWRNHRAYRNLYRRAMVELGLYDPKTYRETWPNRIVGAFFDVYNALVGAYARLMLRVLPKG